MSTANNTYILKEEEKRILTKKPRLDLTVSKGYFFKHSHQSCAKREDRFNVKILLCC